MIAELYIIPESFAYNKSFSAAEIEKKIKALAADFDQIRNYKDTNKILIHDDVYDVALIHNTTVLELLYNNEIARKYLDRDAWASLINIIDKAGKTDITTREVIDVLLPGHNENTCYGLIGFHEFKGVPSEYQIVYNISDWYIFRRYFLALYPKHGDFFIDECKKYFPDLFFHERNKYTINTILSDCPKKIVCHLAALNDKFRDAQRAGETTGQILKRFSIDNKLDETASLQGNVHKKAALTFQFLNDQNEVENVCCESHLKLSRNDGYPGDSSYSKNRRVYFHEGKAHIQKGRILIGHIGKHL
jgi:hypothetical protein